MCGCVVVGVGVGVVVGMGVSEIERNRERKSEREAFSNYFWLLSSVRWLYHQMVLKWYCIEVLSPIGAFWEVFNTDKIK